MQELELGVDSTSMARLLEFLQYSFSGGTDVDRPFELALQRLQTAEWSQVRSKSCWPKVIMQIVVMPDLLVQH